MSVILSRLLLRSLVVSLCLLTACSNSRSPAFTAGGVAPTFELSGLDGAKIKLTDYRGKVGLLNFWATWCQPCVEELPSLERLHSKLKDRGFTVLAVGVDDERESFENFKRTFGLTFPIALDDDGSVKATYKLTGVPESFIIGRDGRFVMTIDPNTDEPIVRFMGPREWDTPNVISRVSGILGQ